MSNLDFATLPMFELKFEWFTEEGQANWMDPLVEWMRATGLDPEEAPLMIKPVTGYAGVGVQPVRGVLAVGHAAMKLFATVSASSAILKDSTVAASCSMLAPWEQAVMPRSCWQQRGLHTQFLMRGSLCAGTLAQQHGWVASCCRLGPCCPAAPL